MKNSAIATLMTEDFIFLITLPVQMTAEKTDLDMTFFILKPVNRVPNLLQDGDGMSLQLKEL